MSGNKVLSARESELAVLAWRALEEPKIDYEKLASVANFKNQNSARACFGPIRKKLLEGGYAASSSSSSSPSSSLTTAKGKRSATAAGEDGDDNPTPTKKTRVSRPKKLFAPDPAPASAPVKDEKDVEEADGAEDDEV